MRHVTTASRKSELLITVHLAASALCATVNIRRTNVSVKTVTFLIFYLLFMVDFRVTDTLQIDD